MGLARLPAEQYEVVKESKSPDVILVRSADMHKITIPDTVRAIGHGDDGFVSHRPDLQQVDVPLVLEAHLVRDPRAVPRRGARRRG